MSEDTTSTKKPKISAWKNKVTTRDQQARAAGLVMQAKAGQWGYSDFRRSGWTDQQLIADGRARQFIHPLERHDAGDGTYPEIFWIWLALNEHIWESFVKWARESRKSGRTRYSARTIVERMRWDSDIASTNSKLKIGDHATPYMGRLLMSEYPAEFAGYFSTHERGAHIVTDFISGEEKEPDDEDFE